jgi:hypothetical protein
MENIIESMKRRDVNTKLYGKMIWNTHWTSNVDASHDYLCHIIKIYKIIKAIPVLA